MPKVYIENSDYMYEEMFLNRGFIITDKVSEANLIQFTGGADINPEFYGKLKHKTTYTDLDRDSFCEMLFHYSVKRGVPMAGICRGSQFLHAMAGGRLVQDCDGHATGYHHYARTSWMPGEIIVSSTHHQMMYSEKVGEVLMWADGIATRKESMKSNGTIHNMPLNGQDIEAMYYPSINAISFQPHPEYAYNDPSLKQCEEAYFFILKNYLGVE